MFENVLRDSDKHKYCVSAVIFSLFIFFQLCCCFRICRMMFKINNEMIEWWSESFSSSEFIMQCIMCCISHRNAKTRFTVIVNSQFFHVIVSDDVSSCNSVSLTILIKSSVIWCLVRHLMSSHQKWCRLKLLRMRCLSNLLSSCNKM
jgi:hypothetical protein